jgi:hypothetical protein
MRDIENLHCFQSMGDPLLGHQEVWSLQHFQNRIARPQTTEATKFGRLDDRQSFDLDLRRESGERSEHENKNFHFRTEKGNTAALPQLSGGLACVLL